MAEPERPIVHTVWVGEVLGLMEQLTLKLWLKQGLTPWLWRFCPCQNVPDHVVQCNAAEVLPLESLFTFESDRGFAKGSYSHWSDQFQLAVLYRHGGWYSQLDVSCLQVPQGPLALETYLCPFRFPGVDGLGLQTCVMKLPKGSSFAAQALAELQEKINAETASKIGWFDSMWIIARQALRAGLGQCIADEATVADFAAPAMMLGTERPHKKIQFVHWSNAWCSRHKDRPIVGTFYHELLREADLI